MTGIHESTAARPVTPDDQRHAGDPWCVFCGGLMVDEGDRVVCVGCGTDALADGPRTEAAR